MPNRSLAALLSIGIALATTPAMAGTRASDTKPVVLGQGVSKVLTGKSSARATAPAPKNKKNELGAVSALPFILGAVALAGFVVAVSGGSDDNQSAGAN